MGEAEAQTVQFQAPTDVTRKKRVQVGSGPFGGTGSDLVCDRELLIRSLNARPDRRSEWARVLGIDETPTAVARYIRGLRAVTLTRDTQVTNHSFEGGSAVGYQAILQAGTAVLVDKDGVPVARCRCGNPLLEPVYVKTAKCFGCPPNYRPPPPCEYFDYDDADFRRYDGKDFVNLFDPAAYRGKCYLPYPDPPRVRRRRTPPTRAAPEPSAPATNPSASFSPASGTTDDTYTLSVSGFRPNVSLRMTLTRPDGASEGYTIQTNSNGSGSKTFPRVANPVLGTYRASVTDPGSGDSASASTTVRAASQEPPQPEPQATQPAPQPEAPSDDLQCDPPRSQLEFEQCQARD